MGSFRRSEIDRIIEEFNLNDIKLAKLENRVDTSSLPNLKMAFDEMGIGMFEYSQNDNCVYLSDQSVFYGRLDDMPFEYLMDLQRTVLDESAMFIYLRNIESILSGEVQKVEFEVPIFSHRHNKSRYIKYLLTRIETEDDLIVSGLTQDMTQLANSISDLAESQNLLHQIVNAVPQALFYVGNNDVMEFGNESVEKLLGISMDDWKGRTLTEYRKFIIDHLKISKNVSISKDENHSSFEVSAIKDGEQFEVLIDEVKIYDKNGDVSGRVFVHTNITDRIKDIQKVKKLLKANELLVKVGNMVNGKVDQDTLFEVILEGVISVVDNAEKGCILKLDFDSNLYIAKNIGYEMDYANTFRIPFDDSFAKRFLNNDYRRSVIVRNIQEDYIDEYPDIKNNQRGFKLNANITAPIVVKDQLYGIISIDSSDKSAFDDIDLNLIDLMRSKIEVSIGRFNDLTRVIESSQKDALTGVYNRRFFNQISESYISDSLVSRERFCLVVFDLDDLKITNDSFGHLAGDALIKNFVNALSGKIRKEDILARLGGDEFVGIFRCMSGDMLSDKLKELEGFLADNPITHDNSKIPTKFSYGVSTFPEDGEDMNALVEIADERMYENKAIKKSKRKN